MLSEYSEYIICPDCAHVHKDDLHEGFHDHNSTTWECSECEAQFFVEREFSVYYYAGKITKPGKLKPKQEGR